MSSKCKAYALKTASMKENRNKRKEMPCLGIGKQYCKDCNTVQIDVRKSQSVSARWLPARSWQTVLKIHRETRETQNSYTRP